MNASVSSPASNDQVSVFTTADFLLEYLHDLGVEYVFGVPGGAIEPLYNALARSERKAGIRSVVARHEMGAAFMADGYARETGTIGVCCATTGPGSTNLITGVASAYADRVPLLVITAQTQLPKFGRNALQDSSCAAINTVAMFEHCTCYNTLVSHASQFETKLINALMACLRERRPVHLSVPSDIFSHEHDGIRSVEPTKLLRHHAAIDLDDLVRLEDEVVNAKQIAVFLGDGCGGAMEEIMKFTEMTHAAIITGAMGKRWMHAYHPHYFGVFGFGGHRSARELLRSESVDLIIAIGTALGELATGGWDKLLLNDKLVHIDHFSENFSRSAMARLQVKGDIATVFEQLNKIVVARKSFGRSWGVSAHELRKFTEGIPGRRLDYHGGFIRVDEPDKCFDDSIPIKPQRLMRELSLKLNSNARLLLDAGNAWAWATHYYHGRSHRGNYRIAMGYGAMAWAIGAAIGTALAVPDEITLCITGDGAFLMSAHELTVAVAEKIPVIFLVLNDQAYGMVKHGQRMGGAEPIANTLPLIDFAALARAQGALGFTVKSITDLQQIDFEQLAKGQQPSVIDVYIDGEEQPPMGARVKGLKMKTPGQ